MIASFDSSDEEGDRAELFSPGRGRNKSLVPDSTPSRSHSTVAEESPKPASNAATKDSMRTNAWADKNNDNDNPHRSSLFPSDASNTLPKLQDTSWLGADMSPIQDRPDEHHPETEPEKTDSASFRLGVPKSTASSVAATESFFLAAEDDDDDDEVANDYGGNNNHTEATPMNAIHGRSDGAASSRKSAFGEKIVTSKGSMRPRPTLLGHPLTSAATSKNGDGYGIVAEKDKHNTQRRRRRIPNPLQRTFWSVPTPSVESSPYNMIGGPSRLAADNRSAETRNLPRGNRFVLGPTALVLFCVGLHDVFLAYLGMRRGVTASYGFAWTLPWCGPSPRSLLRFGAFCPERLLTESSPWVSRYWRSFASMVVPISLVEWMLLVWVWTRYLPSSVISPKTNFSRQLSWPVVYLLSAWTGQLWMVAFHRESVLLQQRGSKYGSDGASFPAVSGCAGWGTAGVLCAVGIQVPDRRFPCFLSSIGLVLIHQFQATGSVVGCAAAAFWGWAYSGLWSRSRATQRIRDHPGDLHHPDFAYYHDVLFGGEDAADERRRWTLWHILAAMIIFLLWFCPAIYLVYR